MKSFYTLLFVALITMSFALPTVAADIKVQKSAVSKTVQTYKQPQNVKAITADKNKETGAPNAPPEPQLININSTTSASNTALIELVGSTSAKKIMLGRPYNIKDDLVTRQIISQYKFDEIKDKICAK